MSERPLEQATHNAVKPNICRIKAEAELSALLDDTTAEKAGINAVKAPERAHYAAMMDAAINHLGLNLEGGI